ncbi:MAG: branched-chain amino acid ABC transporter permease [Christensenellaceae bacterium]|jgi:branched-chain amino acid transport system permease protein|nr:branched-chain amino acid ABC transporter permease [Christensenellaceae bacterium]
MKNFTIKKLKIRPATIIVFVVAMAFILLMPQVNSGYKMLCLNLTLIYAMVALSISIMLGMGGQMTFAGVTMMGVGGYFTANMTSGRLGFAIPTLPALLLAPLFTALVALALGLVLLRLRGTYFTFATIGLVQVAWSFYSMNKPAFGGYDGISGVPKLDLFGFVPADYNQWFYILAGGLVIVALIIERIRKTQFGRSLAAVRDNETAALTLGINVYITKVYAFAVAGAICGFAGALYAMMNRYISADTFTFDVGVRYIIMAMLGGVNNTIGCILGAVLIGMLPEWLRVLQGYMQFIYGIGIILLMIFMPMGLSGVFLTALKRYRKKKKIKLEHRASQTAAEKGEA